MPNQSIVPHSVSKIKGKRKPQLSHRYLTGKHLQAAALEATGKTNAEICQRVGITVMQLGRMRKMPKYQEELQRQIDILNAKISGSILGNQVNRLKIRDQLYKNLQHIRVKRSHLCDDDPELEAQGGRTGLIVAEPILSAGKRFGRKFTIDHETIDQIESLANETAKDLGQLGGDKGQQQGVVVNITFTQEDQAWL